MHHPSSHHLGEAKRILLIFHGAMSFVINYVKVSDFYMTLFKGNAWEFLFHDCKNTVCLIFSFRRGCSRWILKKKSAPNLRNNIH